jgi:RNA polymerase sigma-70 factor, ECF subfamily
MSLAQEATSPRGAAETAEHLFQEHSGWIYGYCLRVLRSPEEAEDALQTTYLNACRSLRQGTRPHAGSAWLLHIAKNVCFARLRSAGRRGKVERTHDVTILAETVAAPEPPDELVGLVEALESLPERQRQAILLREWRGLSYREVAHQLGATQASVETLICRARRSLAEALEEQKQPNGTRLHALNVGALLASIKGFLTGGAAVKAVATLAVATATTATVVATDPADVWFDRSTPGTDRAPTVSDPAALQAAALPSADGPPPIPDLTRPRPARVPPAPGRHAERGRSSGQTTAAAAKAKKVGKGKAKAADRAKSRRDAAPASGQPDWAGLTGPPPQARTVLSTKAEGGAKKS